MPQDGGQRGAAEEDVKREMERIRQVRKAADEAAATAKPAGGEADEEDPSL